MACDPPSPLPAESTNLYLPDQQLGIPFGQTASFKCFNGYRFLADPNRASFDLTCNQGANIGDPDFYAPTPDASVYAANECVMCKLASQMKSHSFS